MLIPTPANHCLITSTEWKPEAPSKVHRQEHHDNSRETQIKTPFRNSMRDEMVKTNNRQFVSLAESADKAMLLAIEKMRELQQRIRNSAVKDDEEWFRNLLLGILRSGLTDYRFLEIGSEQSLPLAAWACRNLLELKVITRYVLKLKNNAMQFRDELTIDGKEFYDAVSKHEQVVYRELSAQLSELATSAPSPVKEIAEMSLRKHEENFSRPSIAASEAMIWARLMAECGLTPSAKPKRSSALARLVQEQESFDPMFKICSKVLHRTAFSIAMKIAGEKEHLKEIGPFLFSAGGNYLLAIYGAIETHFKQRGVQPPER